MSPTTSKSRTAAKAKTPARKRGGAANKAAPSRTSAGRAELGPIVFSHPEKELWPEVHLTKAELGEYYAVVAEHMLKYEARRLLSLVCCPQGRKHCFFQKHLTSASKLAIPSKMIKENNGSPGQYSYLEKPRDLQALVQLNALEIHPWNSRIERLEHPDQLIFDLDPGPNVSAKTLIQAAFLLREMLEEQKLKTFVRVTGGKGLHLVAPLDPVKTWDQVKNFTRTVATTLSEHAPEQFVSKMTKSIRDGKIFVDYLRNGRGATAIGNYSTRARDRAPVAVPLAWSELEGETELPVFEIADVLKRLKRQKKDAWIGFEKLRQRIP